MRDGTLLLALPLLLAACGGTASDDADRDLRLEASATVLVVGFDAWVTPASPAGSLVWSSSASHVACVDDQGRVRACSPGAADIRARSPSTGAEGSIRIEVTPDAAFNTSLPSDVQNLEPGIQRTAKVERCEVELTVPGIAATTVTSRFRRYHRLHLPLAATLGEIGRPELPVYALRFAIPVDPATRERAAWHVEVTRSGPRTHAGIRPWPHQPPDWIDGASAEPVPGSAFVADEAAYTAEDAYPDRSWWAEAVEVGNLPILEVRVAPLRYRPAAEVLELYRTVRVVVTFQGSGTSLVMPRPLGDYKGIQERGPDERAADDTQNADLMTPLTAVDLLKPLPPPDTQGIQDLPFDLLIVTRPTLEPSARRLARWRQDHGTRVWLAVLPEATYPDAERIRDGIRALDETNRIETIDPAERPHAMQAVLLFGDAEHIPPFRGMLQRNAPEPTAARPGCVRVTGTDLPYSTLRGPETQVDVALGRISVDSDTQGDDVVQKIEDYESRPAGSTPRRASVYGYFQDHVDPLWTASGMVDFQTGSTRVTGTDTWFGGDVRALDFIRPDTGVALDRGSWTERVWRAWDLDLLDLEAPWTDPTVPTPVAVQVARQDGHEDKCFVLAAERIRSFLDDLGVEVRWGHTRTDLPGTDPVPNVDFEGRFLPGHLATYTWDVDATDIADHWDDWEDGIVLHSGHGSPERWNDPRFHMDELLGMPVPVPDPWYPIVFSINCSTGYFDTETDEVSFWNPKLGRAVVVPMPASSPCAPNHAVCFCERVLRVAGGGGVAAVGATRGTTSRYNDRLIDGLFGALYAEYARRGLLPGPHPRRARERLGEVFRDGKRTMGSWVSSPGGMGKPDSALFCLQTYHLFGDPMLRVRPPRPD